jgi:hypothetical protein
MQKWEYMKEYFVLQGPSRDHLQTKSLNELGDQGWELVSTYIIGYGNSNEGYRAEEYSEICTFKRPK